MNTTTTMRPCGGPPAWVSEMLAPRFNATQMHIINSFWVNYIQIRFGSATERALIESAQTVLECHALEVQGKL